MTRAPLQQSYSHPSRVRRAANCCAAALAATCVFTATATAQEATASDIPQAKALSPADELATFHFGDDQTLTAELVAAEPDVVSPVAICWDADGVMFVAEMRGYPQNAAAGTIRRLVDADGDGRYETATIFADHLNFPNGVLCVRDGLLVTAAPDLLFLRDTNGDGVADERRVLFTGFGEGNQQLRANGLVWGLDNWIYGANGRSDGVVRRPDEPESAGVSIRTRDFRFLPDGSRFEATIGQSQFGQTRNDAGDRFLSWNTIPIRQPMFDEADLARNPRLAAEAVHNLADPADAGEVFPQIPRPQTFNRESTNHYNALCGLTIYRGDALMDRYKGQAFVGESLSSLVHLRSLVSEGPTFVSRRSAERREFLAAADPWFHPVNFATGPDGALYICDFYRRWVEHPQFVAGAWKDKVDWREGDAHGRIWRIRYQGGFNHARLWVDRATTSDLVVALAAPNGWTRDTAQRLLVERQDVAAVALVANHLRGHDPVAKTHALWTLAGLNALDDRLIQSALADPFPPVRRQALILAAPRFAESAKLRNAVLGMGGDPDDAVRFHVARTLGAIEGKDKLPALVTLARISDDGGWIARALSASAADVAGPFITALFIQASEWVEKPSGTQLETLEQLAEHCLATGQPSEREELLRLLAAAAKGNATLPPGKLAVLAGAVRAARQNGPEQPIDERLAPLLLRAAGLALDDNLPMPYRALAVRVLADGGSAEQCANLLPLAGATETGQLVDAAVTAICRRGEVATIEALFANWSSSTPARRRLLVQAALESLAASGVLIGAIEQGIVQPAEIDPLVRTAFTKVRDAELAARAEKAFASAQPAARDEVLAKYRPALELSPDRKHGAALFKAHCLTCHIMFGVGRVAGPDLSGIAVRPKETLLGDVLDPSRQVSPDYLSYTLVTRDGRTLAGILVSDTPEAVTLRRGEGADDTVLKRDIEELQASAKSLMPEGFEQRLNQQDVADLLEFLSRPERRLLEVP